MDIRQWVFQDGDSLDAGLAALQAIQPDLVLAFGAPGFIAQPGLRDRLAQAFPKASLAGCSTAGEIVGDRLVVENSGVLTALHFGKGRLRQSATHLADMADSFAAGQRVGQALADPELRGVLLFGPGVAVNGSSLVAGLASVVGDQVPICGGLAGDGGAFRQTWVLSSAGCDSNGVVAIGLYGEAIRLCHGSAGGWESFGPARRVTRCEGNILYELDGEPALAIYKRYLGEYARDLPASGLLFPFSMARNDQTDLGLIRTILGVDEDAGSLILAGEIDSQGYLKLMHAKTDALVNGAEQAAGQAREQLPDGTAPRFALLVSCVGRKLVMGGRVDEEVEAVADVLGPGTVLGGFYSYGEISPSEPGGCCQLHNQTMTVTLIGEA